MSRVVVISGAGSGIGARTAERFAREGDQLVLLGRRQKRLQEVADRISGSGAPVPRVIAADLTEVSDVTSVTELIIGQHRQVDVLVHSAGNNAELTAEPGSLEGVAGALWHWTENFRANTLTAVLLTEALKSHLAPEGRVLFISSIAAYRGSGSGSYAAAKAALHPYAYDLAGGLGEQGVTVNIVAPGFISDTEFFKGRLSAERESRLIKQTATGRAGTPDDVAETLFWLASRYARHVTGQVIQVNGGAELGR